jgi:hypothetical protein
MALVSVWFREGRVFAVPSGGHGLDIEPVQIVPPEAAALSVALRAALDASAASPADLAPPPKGWRSPLLKAAGVRSYKAFYVGARLCMVIEDGGELSIERWQPARDLRGFEPSTDAPIEVGVGSLGELLLAQLRD